jgi:glycosyltransferase involved in cell wall biosynthesis
MKICHITYAFPPIGGGGTQTHNYSLIRYLVQRGYDVDSIVVRPPSVSRKEVTEAANTINKGIKVHNIWYNGFPFWIFRAIKKIREIEKEGKVDIFDIHSTNDVFIFLLRRRPVLCSLHLFELNCPGSRSVACPRPCLASLRKCWRCAGVKRYFAWRLVRWLAEKRVTKFMVKYEYMKKLAVESGLKESKIEIVPHWLDIEKFREKANNPALRIRGVSKGDKLLIHVGRLSPENGVWELLAAFGILTEKISNAKLILVGDGISRPDMEDYCRQHHVENTVIFVGTVAREDVFRYLALADCAISCQLYHNYNWSLLEYMCAQKPIVATNVGGTTEILEDGYNALLAETTPESLSSKMQQVLESPQLAKKLAINALATVRRKHGSDNLKKYEELIHRLKK